MQRATLLVAEVVTFVISDQVDNRPIGQGGRLIENEPPVLDTGSERAHAATLRLSRVPDKPSRGAAKAGRSVQAKRRSDSNWLAAQRPNHAQSPVNGPQAADLRPKNSF